MARRAALAVLVALALLVLWPWWADAWTSSLRALALPLSRGGSVLGPPTASATLAAVVPALLLLPMTLARRVKFAGLAIASSLGVELLVVLLGALLSLPASVLPLLAGLAQDAVPAAWLVVAFMSSRTSASGA